MAREIEISSLDLRYESHRMKNPALEGRLLSSIAERGIEEPLEGVELAGRSVLLNGFKRLRCARKLGLRLVPYASLGEDAAQAIVNLLRISNNKSLSILEQAGFVDELKVMHGMRVAEIC
jgi:ParB-like chromosome segregation protein Spo0J